MGSSNVKGYRLVLEGERRERKRLVFGVFEFWTSEVRGVAVSDGLTGVHSDQAIGEVIGSEVECRFDLKHSA
jgi:hypothetical protein